MKEDDSPSASARFPALDLLYPPDEPTSALQELLYACLDDFQPVAIEEHEAGDGWRVFFKTVDSRTEAARALNEQFGRQLMSVTALEVPDEGWAAKSQARLGAVRIGRIVVAPPWDTHAPKADDIVVAIEPSMGFGTGHHATTRLCLRLLQQRRLSGGRVVDVGTGSGVLAIAAWRLGAAETVAVDCDPDALENARHNVERNGGGGAIHLLDADLSALDIEPADVVLANLTSAVLQRYAPGLDRLIRRGGALIVSGFGPDELSTLEGALGRKALQSLTEGDWSAALFGSRLPEESEQAPGDQRHRIGP